MTWFSRKWLTQIVETSPTTSERLSRFSVFRGRERGNLGRCVDRGFRGTRGGLNPLRCAQGSSWNMDRVALEGSYTKEADRLPRRRRRSSPGFPAPLHLLSPMSCRGKKSFPGAGGFTEINALASGWRRCACSAEKDATYDLASISAWKQQTIILLLVFNNDTIKNLEYY